MLINERGEYDRGKLNKSAEILSTGQDDYKHDKDDCS